MLAKLAASNSRPLQAEQQDDRGDADAPLRGSVGGAGAQHGAAKPTPKSGGFSWLQRKTKQPEVNSSGGALEPTLIAPGPPPSTINQLTHSKTVEWRSLAWRQKRAVHQHFDKIVVLDFESTCR